MAPVFLAYNQKGVGPRLLGGCSNGLATNIRGPIIAGFVAAATAKVLGLGTFQKTQRPFESPLRVLKSLLSVCVTAAVWSLRGLIKPSTRNKLLSGNFLLLLMILLIVSGANCRRSGEYGAKPPADYDQDYDEGDDYEKPESDESENIEISPSIKYQTMADMQPTHPNHQFQLEKIEPIRPKRQKMGRTKLLPPTTRPANFKVSPEIVMSKYLHDSAEPVDYPQSAGNDRKHIKRWETKKIIPKPRIDDAEYDYTAEKLQGIVKSPEDFYDLHKDDYADDYDRRDYDPRIGHLKFIIDPKLKKRPSPTDRVATRTKLPPTRSTTKSELYGSQPTRTPTPYELADPADLDPTTLDVIPLFTKSTSEKTETLNVPQAMPVYVKETTEPPESTRVSSEVFALQSVLPLQSNKKATRPPVFLRQQTETIHGLPTMMLGDKGPVAFMVAEGLKHGNDVEDARYKIRNYMLRQGVDPHSNPDELICEYVEMESSASMTRLTQACFLACLIISLQSFELYL